MNDTYRLALAPRCISHGVSEEDDPARSRFVDRLLREKKRPRSNWRDILATDMTHQRWIKQPDEKP